MRETHFSRSVLAQCGQAGTVLARPSSSNSAGRPCSGSQTCMLLRWGGTGWGGRGASSSELVAAPRARGRSRPLPPRVETTWSAAVGGVLHQRAADQQRLGDQRARRLGRPAPRAPLAVLMRGAARLNTRAPAAAQETRAGPRCPVRGQQLRRSSVWPAAWTHRALARVAAAAGFRRRFWLMWSFAGGVALRAQQAQAFPLAAMSSALKSSCVRRVRRRRARAAAQHGGLAAAEAYLKRGGAGGVWFWSMGTPARTSALNAREIAVHAGAPERVVAVAVDRVERDAVVEQAFTMARHHARTRASGWVLPCATRAFGVVEAFSAQHRRSLGVGFSGRVGGAAGGAAGAGAFAPRPRPPGRR